MTTFATLFSGGELAGVGMRNAGLVVAGGLTVSGGLTMTVKYDILISAEVRNKKVTVNTAGFLFPVKNHSFGACAPTLFRNGRFVLSLSSQDTARLNGVGALSFKSNGPNRRANVYPALTHTVEVPTMHVAKHSTAATPGAQIPLLKLNRVML